MVGPIVIARSRQATKQSRSERGTWGPRLLRCACNDDKLIGRCPRAAVFVGVDLGTLLEEGFRFLLHAGPGVVADLLGDLHRAEFRAAHRAEMRELGAFGAP